MYAYKCQRQNWPELNKRNASSSCADSDMSNDTTNDVNFILKSILQRSRTIQDENKVEWCCMHNTLGWKYNKTFISELDVRIDDYV